LLELHRADIAQRLMPPLPVVEDLDVIEDRRSGLFLGDEVAVVHEFVLEVAEEALRHRVVVGVALGTDAELKGTDLFSVY
jgi:hypothetical protein